MLIRIARTMRDIQDAMQGNMLHGAFKMADTLYFKSPGLSYSSLKHLLISPRHFLHYNEPNEEYCPSKAQNFGTALHCFVLQRRRYEREVAITPTEINRRTKAGKAQWTEFLRQNHGKIIITPAEDDMIREISRGLPHRIISLIESGISECGFFTELHGHQLRCKPDCVIEEHKTIIDLKTTDYFATESGFLASIKKYRYDLQAAMYLDIVSDVSGVKFDKFIFIAIEKNPPYCCNFLMLDEESIEYARHQYSEAIALYRQCLSSGIFPSYSHDIKILSTGKKLL